MPDETKPVTSLTLFAESHPSPATTIVARLQRGLLVALAIVHLVTPFIFVFGHGDLVRDAVLQSQISLFILALIWGGFSWPVCGGLVIAGLGLILEWHLVIPEAMWHFVYETVVVPSCGLLTVVLGLRLASVRGAWSSVERPAAPFQISIGQLLVVTTVAAVSFAGASWMRRIPTEWIGDAGTNYALVTIIDGLGIAGLALIAAWAVGVRGGVWLKLLMLVAAAVLFGGCQIYAFKMDELWPYLALSSTAWLVMVAGSLGIWRVCGWHLIRGSG